MVYRVTLNGIDILGTTAETYLPDASAELELNDAGSATFTIPPGHPYYDAPQVLTSDVEIYEDNESTWFGRVMEIETDFYRRKRVYCEGALGYFNDSVQRPAAYEDILISDFFRQVIAAHNAQVPAGRQFTVGEVAILDRYVTRKIDYATTLDVLNSMCLDAIGGYFFLRKENGSLYIDWVDDMPYQGDQPVQFALNLLDIGQSLNGADICTAVLPLGASLSRIARVNESTAYCSVYESMDLSSTVVGRVQQGGEVTFDYVMGTSSWYRISDPYVGYALAKYLTVQGGDLSLTISYANDGSDILENEEGISTYGRITKIQEWPEIRSADELKAKAARWLTDEQYDRLTIECTAADLHYINGDYGAFRLGQMVRVTSTPHLLDKDLPITRIALNLSSAKKEITIGTPPRRTLTEIVAEESKVKPASGYTIFSGSIKV